MVDVFIRLSDEPSADPAELVWKGMLLYDEEKEIISRIIDPIVISNNFSMISIIEQRIVTYKSFLSTRMYLHICNCLIGLISVDRLDL